MKTSTCIAAGIISLFFAAGSAGRATAEDIRILAPYVGYLTNVYEDSAGTLNLKDGGLLTGLYFQWINPERYQWNAFAYYAPDVNYSRVLGGHFIFDWYLGPNPRGKYVLGCGMEYSDMEMDAGDSISGTRNFTMSNLVLVPYLRAGKYFKADWGPAAVSMLPWAGIEREWVRGDVDMEVYQGPVLQWQSVSGDISDDYLYALSGVNLKVTLFHFIDVEGKYQIAFDDSARYSTWSCNATIFFMRHWGLSWRFKYMEHAEGSDTYNYAGLVWCF